MEKTTAIVIRGLIVFAAFLWILSSVAEAATIEVDCSSATLQAAIEKAKPGDTLLVSGTCKENLVIHEEVARITLDGQGKATVNGPDASKSTIEVRGRGITIKGFTVTGGRNGMNVTWGGQAVIEGNTVQGVPGFGIIVIRTSHAVIVNNTVQNNARHGILISHSSFGFVGGLATEDKTARPNIIENNGRNGILVNRSAGARIVGNTIRNNKRYGVRVQRGSNAEIANNTIDGNARDGISVSRNSAASLGRDTVRQIHHAPNTTTANNKGFGISCSIGGAVDGRLGTLNGEKGEKSFKEGCVDSLKP